MYWKIKQTFIKIMGWPRDIKYGIKNLIKWFPVIWKDRDWDQWFLYKILYFKLKEMEYNQRVYGHHVNNEKVADQIKTCKLLAKRLIDNDYLENSTYRLDKKWGEHTMTFIPCEDNPEFLTAEFKTENAITDKEKKQENKERMVAYKHSDYLENQDLDMLFKNIRKHIQGWWD